MLVIHTEDRAYTTSDGRRYEHDATSAGRKQALAQLEKDTALQFEASNRRSLQERGRPATQHELENGWCADDLRGPHEKQADDHAKTSAVNSYQLRLDLLRSQHIDSKEIPALEAKAASWTPAVIEAAPPENPYAVAVSSLLSKQSHLPAERALTERAIANLRDAETKWQAEQDRAAQVKAFEAMPERINAIENAEATYRLATLIPATPSWHLEASKANLLALKNSTDADGGVKAFFEQQRKDNKALWDHQDKMKADWTAKGEQHAREMKEALSLAPVEAPVVVEPVKSAIEIALTNPPVVTP